MEANQFGAELLSVIGASGEWAIQIDEDTAVSIVSLSPGKIGEIAKQYEATFNDIVFYPMNRVDVLEATVLACFEKAKKTPPKLRFQDTRDLLPYLVELPSTLPPPDIAIEPDGEGAADPTDASSTDS